MAAHRLPHDMGTDMNRSDSIGVNPSRVAAVKGHCDVIRLLHGMGADMNRSANNGDTRVGVILIMYSSSFVCFSVELFDYSICRKLLSHMSKEGPEEA